MKQLNMRSRFSLDSDVHYLNNAYMAPLLKAGEQAMITAMKRTRNPQVLKPNDFFAEVKEAQQLYAQLIGCHPDRVAIIPSASYGFSLVLSNVDPKAGGNAITVADEFPSGYFALKRFCDDREQDLLAIGPGTGIQKGNAWNDNILESINEQTSVVLISVLHWMDGLRFDLEAIGKRCKEVDAVFVVDGSQSIGASPLNVDELDVDAVITAGYKWLFGPYSLGLAYLGPRFDSGKPIEESWMNRLNAAEFSNLTTYDPQYKPAANRYHVGETSHLITMPGLIEGLKQVLEVGPGQVQAYAEELGRPLIQFFVDNGTELDDNRSHHLFGLKLPGKVDPKRLMEKLAEQKVILSLRGESLRVSINVFNTEADIQAILSILDESKN